MNHPVRPGMTNSTFNSNPTFSSMPNLRYPHTPFNTQFAQFDPINRNPAPNRYPNPSSNSPFPQPFITPLPSNNNHGALSIPSVLAPGISSSNDSFTFTSQNNLETLKKFDLGETIRVFKQLISQAETTVRHISDLVKLNTSDCGKKLSVCPFDSSHRMPAEHLFRHFLCCLSSPGVVGLEILSTVRYPETLRSEKDLSMQLFKPLPGSALDICIAIEEDEGLLGSDFFYKDAPGVVRSTQGDVKKTFSLSNILYTECVDSENENSWLTGNCNASLLPSEFLALRTELTSWNNFPSRHCFVTLVAAMGLGKIQESDIIYWIIQNSPAFGIIIDLAMSRHIALLSKLCLKAISHEAFGIYQKEIEVKDVRQNHDGNELGTNILTTTDKFSRLQTTHFDCPVLLESVTWFASEMSTLYGQTCGRSFVIGMLQHSFVCAGKAISYPVVGKLQTITNILDVTEVSSVVHNSDAKENATSNASKDGTSNAIMEKNLPKSNCIISTEVASGDACEHEDGIISESRVFVSQVAAAVAALLERFLLEERIKGLWHLRRLSKFQLFAEHDIAVKKAAEEREKRLNYKPILEHDGLVWQRSYQDSKKHKTREQLLAEERDYKRRRMSYRGKKVKRTPTQVLHDIIEGHMEEIRLAGGIGCFIKGASETPQIATGSIHLDVVGQNTQELRNPNSFFSDNSERLSFRRHYPVTFDDRANSSKRLIGEMDIQTSNFGDGNIPKNHKRNDYDQDYDNNKHYNAKLSHDDDSYHFSGHSSETIQGHETRHHSRSLYRSPDVHRERNSRSHCEHENSHRSRSQERKHESRCRSISYERKDESGHISRSHERKHESRHISRSRERKHESGHISRSRERKHESGHISRSHERKHESRHRSRSLERRHESRHRSRSLELQHEIRHRSRSHEHKHQPRNRSRSRDHTHERRHRRSLERNQSNSNDFERWQLT